MFTFLHYIVLGIWSVMLIAGDGRLLMRRASVARALNNPFIVFSEYLIVVLKEFIICDVQSCLPLLQVKTIFSCYNLVGL